MTVTLVTFEFRDDRYVAPASETVATATLRFHLDRVRDGARPRFAWPWADPGDDAQGLDCLAWLAANTTAKAHALVIEPTLAQCVLWADRSVTARYLFDHEYATAHPEALDPVHLSLAHGTIAAKLFDDGVIALTDDGVRASLRWRPRNARGTRLGPEGHRVKS